MIALIICGVFLRAAITCEQFISCRSFKRAMRRQTPYVLTV